MSSSAPLLIAALLLGAQALLAPPGDPTSLTARAGPGPYLVGQPIEVRVEVAGSSGPAKFEPPNLADAEVRETGREPGGAVARFVVVARKAGVLNVPPFRLDSGGRKIASRPIRLTIANVPARGRTPAFLGGVGPFEIQAEAEPAKVRVGQTLEYRLKITGPAAWGSLRAPDLSGWASLPPRFRVEAIPPGETTGEPPSRTFRYRLRPTSGGRFVLPPVAVAAFDPGSQSFATRYSPGVPIEVEEPAKLDPARVEYPDESGSKTAIRLVAAFWLLVTIGSGLAMLSRAARIARARRAVDPVRLAAELAGEIDPSGEESEVARRVTAAVATFLERVGGRPAGVLTPPEAREHSGRITLDPELAGRVGRLIERCDRARYGGPSSRPAGGLADEAKGLLLEIGRAASKRREGAAEGGSRGR